METYLLIGLSAANLILLAVLLALTARTRRDRREADELRRMQEKLDGCGPICSRSCGTAGWRAAGTSSRRWVIWGPCW